jgi:putative FmdB family regulatory protein
MPLYEFKCMECGHELEVLQKISAPHPTDCPACQKPGLQKKVTAAGFQLKGSGWYVTDFRGGQTAPKASTKTESTAAAQPESTPVAKTEAPAASSPSTPAAV